MKEGRLGTQDSGLKGKGLDVQCLCIRVFYQVPSPES